MFLTLTPRQPQVDSTYNPMNDNVDVDVGVKPLAASPAPQDSTASVSGHFRDSGIDIALPKPQTNETKGMPRTNGDTLSHPVSHLDDDITSTQKTTIQSKEAAIRSDKNGDGDTNASSPETQTYVDEMKSPATRLKERIENTNDLIVCPGVYDGFSARIALAVGFEALYMTGAGTTASKLGQADLGIAQLHDMREHAEMIANLDPNGPPLIADMDTGYGGPIVITNAVNQYIRANVAGFHIEDQVLTKRCGHLSGKKVVPKEGFLSRIRAAKAAKDRARSNIVLIARTDANQQLGYDECISRLREARALGADVGLLEGFKSKEQAKQAVQDLAPWPLLLNIVENGHSPLITVDEAREMGFRIMIFSFAALAPAYGAIRQAFERLKTEGVTGNQGKGVSPKFIFDVCGLKDCMAIDAGAGGDDFQGGV